MYKKNHRKLKSTRNIPLQQLEANDIKAFLLNGWRVVSKSNGIRVLA